MDAISPEHILKLYSEAVQMPARCYLMQGRAVLYCPLSRNLPRDEMEDRFLLENMPEDGRPLIYVNRCGEVYGLLPVDAAGREDAGAAGIQGSDSGRFRGAEDVKLQPVNSDGDGKEIYITGPGRPMYIGDAEFRSLYRRGRNFKTCP